MKSILPAILAIALTGSAAYAELYDIRSHWAMTCFPSNAMQYSVETFGTRKLVITSSSGVARAYHVTGQKSLGAGKGFAAFASGWGRNLVAVFGPQYGQLRSGKGFDHCSGEMPESSATAPINPPEPALNPAAESGEEETTY